jgi:hypothetical protein
MCESVFSGPEHVILGNLLMEEDTVRRVAFDKMKQYYSVIEVEIFGLGA